MAKPANVLPWSYSSLSSFETCPRRHKLTRMDKVVTEPPSEAMLHGNAVHKALENYLNGAAAMPEKYATYEPLARKVKDQTGKRLVEYKFGVTEGFKPTTFFAGDVWFRGVIDVGVVSEKSATLLDWKGLALDTPIPTPSGWTTMGEISEGDSVFDSEGRACRVVGKSQVHNRKCYQLNFDDTTSVVCDDQHLWVVDGEVLSAETLFSNYKKRGQAYRKILLTAPLELPEVDVPIHPYVLGLWLGDGKHTSGEICKPDEAVWEKVVAVGHTIGADISAGGKCRAHTVLGIRGHLRRLNVYKNKHIPQLYLRASFNQRLDLLRGLMDSDGNVNSFRKQAVFTTCSKALSDGVVELLCSLGQRPLQSKTSQAGFGKTVTAWPVSFRPQMGINPFHLPRKADLCGGWGAGKSFRRLITSVAEVKSVPTQCIAVDSPTRTYLCTRKFLPTHNTGKPKVDGDQMKLFAAAGFAAFPYLQTVRTGYVWLQHNKLDSTTFKREDLPDIWNEFTPRVIRMVKAQEEDKFPPKPSGLCRAWCPVPKSLCEFSGKEG